MHRSVLWGVVLLLAGCQCVGPGGGDGGAGGAGGSGGGFDAGSQDAGPGDAGALDASIDLTDCPAVTWPSPLGCTGSTLEGRLGCVPGLSVQPGTPLNGHDTYELALTQWVDHRDADAGTFVQRATLYIGDPGAPTVLTTTGYQLWRYVDELTAVFGANQLTYEHRYFSASRPLPTDWRFLTIEQAAFDAHEWALALRWALPGRWLSTGASKGGMTSVYHRRFFPCDVEATVGLVTPVTYGALDDGYGPFIADAGGAPWAACREELTQFQRRLLQARSSLVPQLTGSFLRVGGADEAFELAVVELPFAFWQYTSPDDPYLGCAAIPPATATDAELLQFLNDHSPVAELASDSSLSMYEPYYYQAATQIGSPAPYEAPVADLLRYPGADVAQTYAPVGVPLPLDTAAMLDVNQWVNDHGERLMLIYGEFDPWSTHELPLGAARDSARYLVAGGNHSARVGLLSPQDKEAALGMLERWVARPRRYTPQALHVAPPGPRRVPR